MNQNLLPVSSTSGEDNVLVLFDKNLYSVEFFIKLQNTQYNRLQ